MMPDQLIVFIGKWGRLTFLVGLTLVAAAVIVVAEARFGAYVPLPAPLHTGWRLGSIGAGLAGIGGFVGLLFGGFHFPRWRSG